MELTSQKKLANHIFRLLKVNEIVIPIGRTNKGNLGIKFSANSDDFEIYLDAVPLRTTNILEDENNIELKKMLEKYLFEQPTSYVRAVATERIDEGQLVQATEAPKKKRGRPKKIK